MNAPLVSLARFSFVLVLVCATGSGCDLDSMSSPALTEHCSQLGAQCQLAEGPLGVCENIACDSGAEPPCFRCVDQH